MNDAVLLFTGVGVFSLMMIAIILTILEFRQLGARAHTSRQGRKKRSRSPEPGE